MFYSRVTDFISYKANRSCGGTIQRVKSHFQSQFCLSGLSRCKWSTACRGGLWFVCVCVCRFAAEVFWLWCIHKAHSYSSISSIVVHSHYSPGTPLPASAFHLQALRTKNTHLIFSLSIAPSHTHTHIPAHVKPNMKRHSSCTGCL